MTQELKRYIRELFESQLVDGENKIMASIRGGQERLISLYIKQYRDSYELLKEFLDETQEEDI